MSDLGRPMGPRKRLGRWSPQHRGEILGMVVKQFQAASGLELCEEEVHRVLGPPGG